MSKKPNQTENIKSTKKEIIEESQFEDWINNKMKETDKYKQTTDKKIEILNLNKYETKQQ